MPSGITGTVEDILYSGKLAFGAHGHAFETALNEYLGSSNTVVVSSFGSAIELMLNIFRIGPDSEVIMSPMGCLRSSQPVACRGARIVWADIDPATGTLSPESVEQKITARTRLIVNYHHLGYVGYTDELNRIGAEHGIPVVEDCLDGIGGEYKGKKVGVCGDAAVISFDAVRLPNAIDGGAVVFRDPELASMARLKRDLGVDRQRYRDGNHEIYPGCDITMTGYACTLSDVHSVIALRQMPELESLLGRRRANADWWRRKLADRTDCRPLHEVPGTRPNYWVFGLLTDRKLELLKEFRAQGYFASGIHLQNNLYSVFGQREKLPGTEEFHRRFLALPTPSWCEL